MPTGYTYKVIEEGQSFEDFAKDCTRAFVSWDGVDFTKPNDYYSKALEEAMDERDEFLAKSPDELLKEYNSYKEDQEKENQDYINRYNVSLENYNRVLEQAQAWIPPTPEHEQFKKFMIDQLLISKPTNYYSETFDVRSYEDWYKDTYVSVIKNVTYYEGKVVEEANKAKGYKEWFDAVMKTLT